MSQLKIQFSNEYFEQRKWLCDINAVVLQVLWENTRNRNWRRCDQDLRSDNTIQNHRSVALKRKILETDFLGSLFIRTRFIENKLKRTSFYGLCTTSTCSRNCTGLEPFLCLIFYFVNKKMDSQQVEIWADLWKTCWKVFYEDVKMYKRIK